MSQTIARKLTVKDVHGNAQKLRLIETRTMIATIFGVAHSFEEKSKVMPDEKVAISFALKGEFHGVSGETGEISIAPVAYLIDPADQQVVNALKGGAQSVEFAFDFYANPSDKSPTGFTWEVVSKMDAAPSSAMERLAKSAGIALPNAAAKPAALENQQSDSAGATGVNDKAEDAKAVKGKGKAA